MSEPQNVLDKYDNHAVYFVLAAFKFTDEAEETELILDPQLDMGDPIGNGIIVVNDVRPTSLQIVDYLYTYVWNSKETSTTLSNGHIVFVDRNPGSFFKFLKNEIINEFSSSLENITFSLRVFWSIQTEDLGESSKIEKSEHLYFSIGELSHQTRVSQNYYTANIIPLHNCKTQLPNYHNLYNMTITHKDGNLHETQPTPSPAGGAIMPRGKEDSIKTEPRNERILKSKPMVTLNDIAEAFEIDLTERKEIHKSQLQVWQSVIRDDFVDKLQRNPKQHQPIPIQYHVDLGDGYPAYKIDNRNLPFEQPEQDQTAPGIRVLPIYTGETIISAIDKIMCLSKEVGIDAEYGQTFKIAMPWRRLKTGIIKYNILVRKYNVPENTATGIDTGPGESAVEPLHFYFRTTKNFDVSIFDGITTRNDIIDLVEYSPDEDDGKVSYGGDRENITVERDSSGDFFESGFSGHRAFVANNRALSVEYPRELASKIKSKYAAQSKQDGLIKITIRGNPKLYSDLLRKPSNVANSVEGPTNYYKFIEYFPLYCKFTIEFAPVDVDEANPNFSESEDIQGPFYHENYMHLYKVETRIFNGQFSQTLDLLRSDDLI